MRFFWRVVNEGIVVVDLDSFEFTLLNGSASLIWLELATEAARPDELAAMIGQVFDRPASSVSGDVTKILSAWRELGWLSTSANGMVWINLSSASPQSQPYQVVCAETLLSATTEARLEWKRDMEFIGTEVSVRIMSDPSHKGSDVLTRARSFLSGLPEATGSAVEAIEMFVTHGGIFLRLGSTCVEAKTDSDALSRLVLWCFYSAYGTEDFQGTFHAAAVGRDEGSIVMPGLSGAGKSTLTAFLAAHGWAYGGDDIVGLACSRENDLHHIVLPFCSAISVKDGALPILAPYYAGLHNLPQVTYDAKQARFPAVPPAWQMGSDIGPRRIKAIVFPRYVAGAILDVSQLDFRETLLALVGVGYRTGERMDVGLLNGVFNFLEHTPTYQLIYSDLKDAERVLRDLL